MKAIRPIFLIFAASRAIPACDLDPTCLNNAISKCIATKDIQNDNATETRLMAADAIRWWANCHACGWASNRVSSEALAWQEGLRHQLSRPEFRFHGISVGSMSMP
jgi:hypothetical protein